MVGCCCAGPSQTLQSRLDAAIGELDARLTERSAIRQRKSTLQLLLRIAQSVEKIERLLEIAPSDLARAEAAAAPTPAIGAPSASTSSHLIERVAAEFSQLQFCTSQAGEVPFVQGMHGVRSCALGPVKHCAAPGRPPPPAAC